MRYLLLLFLLFSTNIVKAEPVIYSFDATWCPACKQLSKERDNDTETQDIIKKYRGFVQLDVDKFPNLAKKWAVKTIPHYLIIEITETSNGTRATHLHNWVPSKGVNSLDSLKKFLKEGLTGLRPSDKLRQ